MHEKMHEKMHEPPERNTIQRCGSLPSLIQKSARRKEGFGVVTAKLLVPGVLSEMHSRRGGTGGGGWRRDASGGCVLNMLLTEL